MSIITQYTNGTFEGNAATWTYNSAQFIGVPFQRSADFAKEGTFSGKFTTINSVQGYNFLFNCLVEVDTADTNYECSFWVRCSAGIPNDVDFILLGAPISGSEVFIIKASAVEAKAGWVKITINFSPIIYTDANVANQVFNCNVWVVGNWTNFVSALGGSEGYPQFEQYIGTNASAIPAGEFVYVDALGSEAAAIIVPPDTQLVGRKLYHVKTFFWLSDGNQVYEIDEPIGWDKILLNINFDLSSFRYKFEFTDKDVTLEFDRTAGYVILKNLWDEKGPDAFASLKFGELDSNNVATIHFEMQLNFAESYNDTKYVVKMNCERRSMQDTFRTRFDTDTDIMDVKTLDEVNIPNLPTVKLWLHPTRADFSATFIGNPQAPATGNIPFTGHYVSVPPLLSKINNIDGMSDPLVPDGSFYYSGSSFKSGINEKRLVITARVRFKVTTVNNAGGASMFLRLFKLSGVTQAGFDPSAMVPLPGDQYEDSFPLGMVGAAVTRTFIINAAGFVMKPDEALFIRIGTRLTDLDNDTDGDSAWVTPELWFMNVDYSETAAPTLVDCYQIHEVLERQLRLITNVAKPLKSDFFGRVDLGYASEGCGSKNVLLNGLLIREIQKQFILSTKDWFNSLRAIYCLGLSIERDNDNNEWIRVEPLEYFFRDVEVLRLTVVSDFERDTASDFMFNELEFGYSKYPNNNQNNSLGDHMTVKKYIEPWKSLKNKCSQISDFILSSLYIQLTRDQNIRNNPTGNFETDANTFMIGVSGLVGNVFYGTNIQFFAESRTIKVFRWDIPVGINDQITIGSTANNNGLKNVINVNVSIELNYIIMTVAEPLVDETVAFTNITFTEARMMANRDEQFDEVSGLTQVGAGFPYYNLRHHVKRMALRWSKFWTTGFRDGFFNRFVSGINNNAVSTTLKADADCINMDGRSGAFAVGDDDKDIKNEAFAIQTMSKALFGKNKITFSAPLSWDSMNNLRKAFEGRHPDDKNYGYITTFDNDGEEVKVFVLDTKFNPITQICKFETIEKAPD